VPAASTVAAPNGTLQSVVVPTQAIRSPCPTMTDAASGGAPVPSISTPPVMAHPELDAWVRAGGEGSAIVIIRNEVRRPAAHAFTGLPSAALAPSSGRLLHMI